MQENGLISFKLPQWEFENVNSNAFPIESKQARCLLRSQFPHALFFMLHMREAFLAFTHGLCYLNNSWLDRHSILVGKNMPGGSSCWPSIAWCTICASNTIHLHFEAQNISYCSHRCVPAYFFVVIVIHSIKCIRVGQQNNNVFSYV